jgi:hypothetical protein
MAKKEVKRTRMSDAEVIQFIKHYAKARDLKGKALSDAITRCAATRWAALERNAKKVSKPAKKKAKGKKK